MFTTSVISIIIFTGHLKINEQADIKWEAKQASSQKKRKKRKKGEIGVMEMANNCSNWTV